MKTIQDKTVPERVVFRRYKTGEIIALFPNLPDDIEGKYCTSYMHIGQHGGADLKGVMRDTLPASPKQYKDLKEELESIGYNLTI